MNIRISGSGTITSGEYKSIKISGSGRSMGSIRCESLQCSGSFSGASDIECENRIDLSGSFENSGTITAKELHVSGSLDVRGSLKGSEITSSGSLEIGKDLIAESTTINGHVFCAGLIRARELHIKLSNSRRAGAEGIFGYKILIQKSRRSKITTKLKKCIGMKPCLFKVARSIEGDEITIDHTRAKTVTGCCVTIGAECQIDLVQYTECADISPKAKVGKVEKV